MQQKITFSELCSLIALRTGLGRREVDEFLRALFATMSDALAGGDTIRLKGLGSFKVSTSNERRSVDVNTGNAITIGARSKISFIPAKELANAVNEPFSDFEAVELADNISEADLEQPTVTASEISTENSPENKNGITPQEPATDSDVKTTVDESDITEESVSEDDSGKTVTEVVVPVAPLAPFVEEESQSDISGPIYIEKLENPEIFDEKPEIEESTETIETHIQTEESGAYEIVDEQDSEYDISEPEVPEDELPQENIAADEAPMRFNQKKIRNKKKRVTSFIIGFVCALLLICAGGILILLLCPNASRQLRTGQNINQKEVTSRQQSSNPLVTIDTDSITARHDTIAKPQPPVAETEKLLAETAEETAPTRPSDTKKVYDTITRTRYLTTIARQHYGNQHFWPYIYEENKAILGHPDRIKPGTKVVVPSLSKYGVDVKNANDIATAKRKEAEIYSRYKKSKKSK